MPPDSITARAAHYVATMDTRDIPASILEEARKCLVDTFAVCVQALDTDEARIVRGVVEGWRTQGPSSRIGGGRGAPPAAALFNGTLSHCLDFDDTHIPSVIHVSGPTWAALMAIGQERGVDETRMLRAFVTAFEVAARLGDHGIGVRLNNAGWHATPALGGIAVAAGVAALLGLDARRTAHAFGLCATEAGGLAASFGTMGKPLHSGKAALDGLLAATLAEAGYTGAPQVLDEGGRFLATLLQDPNARFELAPFEDAWEITRNSFKPYAACQLAHGAIDAARGIRGRVAGRAVRRITAFVHPLAIRIATVIDPTTPTEAKFCVGFCVALALAGYPLSNDDFSDERLADGALRAMTRRVSMQAEDGIERTATRLEVELEGGEVLVEDVRHAFGSIGNPMDWRALDGKFLSSTRAALGARAPALLQTLHRFGERGSLDEALRLTAAATGSLAPNAPAT